MRKGLMNAVLLSLVGLLCLQASAGAVVADRVVAVVGKEAIFKSDIDGPYAESRACSGQRAPTHNS